MGPRTVFMAEESMRYLLIAIFDRPVSDAVFETLPIGRAG